MACKIRDKAQRPSAFISQPCKRLTSSTPELHAQLNLTRVTKRKGPHLKSCACLGHLSWNAWRSCLSVTCWSSIPKKRNVDAADGYEPLKCQKKVSPWNGGQLFNQTTSTGWKSKNGTLITLLKRITNSKMSMQRSFQSVNSMLRQAFPEGFMPPWRIQHESHTCSETSLRIMMWNASYVQKHFS